MGPWLIWLWRLLRNKRFRSWLLATVGPRALALFAVWLERLRHRQIAIDEADQVDGVFSGAIIEGRRHVIVWKDGEPFSAYPPVQGDLAEKLRAHTRRGLTHPDELPTRRARRWLGSAAGRVGETAGRAAGRVGETAGRVRHGASAVGEQARRAGQGAAQVGEAARQLPKRFGRGEGDGAR